MWNIIWGHIYPSVETIWIYWPPTKTWPTYCLPLCDEKAQEGLNTENRVLFPLRSQRKWRDKLTQGHQAKKDIFGYVFLHLNT